MRGIFFSLPHQRSSEKSSGTRDARVRANRRDRGVNPVELLPVSRLRNSWNFESNGSRSARLVAAPTFIAKLDVIYFHFDSINIKRFEEKRNKFSRASNFN